MKENFNNILASLLEERRVIESQKKLLEEKLLYLKNKRSLDAKKCVEKLLPDLEINTAETLMHILPRFDIPLVHRWFFFGKKVDPSISLSMLRMKLGSHLDNMRRRDLPDIWEEKVLPIDDEIRALQEDEILNNSERLDDLTIKIGNLQKILSSDLNKLPLKTKDRLSKAFAFSGTLNKVQSKNKVPYLKPNQKVNQIRRNDYPSQAELDSDEGSGSLAIWLLSQISHHDSDVLREIEKVDTGGQFAGGGASSSFTPQNSTPENETGSIETEGQPSKNSVINAALLSEVMSVHESLGSQNFS